MPDKISELTPVGTLAGGDELAINDISLAASRKATAQEIADLAPAPADASDTVKGIIELAIQSEMETGSDVVRAVVPGRQHFHPSSAKFWAQVTGAGSPALTTNYNVTSVADTATGRMTITIGTDFATANWCCVCAGSATGATVTLSTQQWISAKAAGTVEIVNADLSATPVVEDPSVGYNVVGYGDLA